MGHRLPLSMFGAIDAFSHERPCLNMTSYELHTLKPGQRAAHDDLVLRYLRTSAEIETVQALRAQIDLSHSAGDPQFHAQEKKETSSAWRWRSSLAASW